MSKYKIKEVKKTLNNGEVESVFYVYKPYLFWWTYEAHFDGYENIKTQFYSLESASARIKNSEEQDRKNFSKKVKKTETIIHKL